MEALADRSLGQLLDQVAAKTPAPGGGASSGIVCALAAGLVQMTAAFAMARAEGDERPGAIHERADALRTQALALAEEDLGAYTAVLEALRLPQDAPGRAERVDAALSDATDTPLAIARAAGEVAALAAEMAHTSNVHVRGDALAAGLLADGACRAALQLVKLNLADRPDDPRLAEASKLAKRPWMAALPTVVDV
jgi:formiminotetrahydrofolate cyclodeaminase